MTFRSAQAADEYYSDHPILVDDEVISYINRIHRDFRISTSCGGPVLLPITFKPAKPTDIGLRVGNYTIYISMYQARYIDHIHMGLIPFHVNGPGEDDPMRFQEYSV